MSANVWLIIAIVAFVIAAALATVAVVLFFRLNIKDVIKDLSGKTAQQGVISLREETKEQEKKRNRSSVSFDNKKGHVRGDEAPTDVLNQGDESATIALNQGDEDATTLLNNGDESVTTLLEQGDEGATTLLNQGDEGATTLLDEEKEVDFVVEETVMITGDKVEND